MNTSSSQMRGITPPPTSASQKKVNKWLLLQYWSRIKRVLFFIVSYL